VIGVTVALVLEVGGVPTGMSAEGCRKARYDYRITYEGGICHRGYHLLDEATQKKAMGFLLNPVGRNT
jgi:hypothetical protein